MTKIDIGVFAHNEAHGIAGMISGLARQDILIRDDMSVRVFILANGCSDDTATRAEAAITVLPVADRFEVIDFEAAGKSRTWNAFVHEVSRPEAEQLVFCDADIEIPDSEMLSQLILMLAARPELAGVSSRPVKDIVQRPYGLSHTDRLIAASGGMLNDWRTSICGQLYSLRAEVARTFYLPIGLPVEDGFVRAMVLTRLLASPEDIDCIDGRDRLSHVYASERTIGKLIRHQTRIVIGSAINAAVFEHLRALPAGSIQRALADASRDETWLEGVIRERLPVWPYGWVPIHFLVKRISNTLGTPRAALRPRSVLVLFAGFGFDFVVYALAQVRMARGVGAGHW